MISQQALQEFKAVYEREIGPAPDEKVLVALACDLLTLMDVTYRPVKKEWVEKLSPGAKINGENGQICSPGKIKNCPWGQK
jgi:hypothetical protein